LIELNAHFTKPGANFVKNAVGIPKKTWPIAIIDRGSVFPQTKIGFPTFVSAQNVAAMCCKTSTVMVAAWRWWFHFRGTIRVFFYRMHG